MYNCTYVENTQSDREYTSTYTCTEHTITHRNTENSLCYTSYTMHHHITVMITHNNKNTEIHRCNMSNKKGSKVVFRVVLGISLLEHCICICVFVFVYWYLCRSDGRWFRFFGGGWFRVLAVGGLDVLAVGNVRWAVV